MTPDLDPEDHSTLQRRIERDLIDGLDEALDDRAGTVLNRAATLRPRVPPRPGGRRRRSATAGRQVSA